MAHQHEQPTGTPAMVIKMPDGSERVVTFEELTITNNITLEALVRILLRKGIITEQDFTEEIAQVTRERAPRESKPE